LNYRYMTMFTVDNFFFGKVLDYKKTENH